MGSDNRSYFRGETMRIRTWLTAVRAVVWTAILMSAAASAFAQNRATGRMADPSAMGAQILSTIVFGFIGILMTIVGFKMFDAVIRFDLAGEICEKQNIAVAIVTGAMLIALGMIVAVAVY